MDGNVHNHTRQVIGMGWVEKLCLEKYSLSIELGQHRRRKQMQTVLLRVLFLFSIVFVLMSNDICTILTWRWKLVGYMFFISQKSIWGIISSWWQKAKQLSEYSNISLRTYLVRSYWQNKSHGQSWIQNAEQTRCMAMRVYTDLGGLGAISSICLLQSWFEKTRELFQSKWDRSIPWMWVRGENLSHLKRLEIPLCKEKQHSQKYSMVLSVHTVLTIMNLIPIHVVYDFPQQRSALRVQLLKKVNCWVNLKLWVHSSSVWKTKEVKKAVPITWE